MTSAKYIGRFAPSPTGLLHFGSLLAAMASYCDARSHGGEWRLRIDDIDPPRELADAVEQIPRSLHNYGFVWDGQIIKQSARSSEYLRKLQFLNEQSSLYTCNCSRRKLANQSLYPGYCKPTSSTLSLAFNKVAHKLLNAADDTAVRIIIDKNVSFTDSIQGEQHAIAATDFGDSVVMRRDGYFAYALSCAVDDADGISHVVRGADLLPTTAVQIRIIELLGLIAPQYAHIPMALNAAKQKLSKQTHAEPIDTMPVLATLLRAWHFLGQSQLNVHSIEAFWQAAIPSWRIERVPRQEYEA